MNHFSKEQYFWMAIPQYYFWTAMAITTNPAYLVFTAILFFVIPQTTETELVPGIKTLLNSQTEVLKTQRYLSRERYYQ